LSTVSEEIIIFASYYTIDHHQSSPTMSIKDRYSAYALHPESPASVISMSFDKYPTSHEPNRGSRNKEIPRLPNFAQTTMHHGANGHAATSTASGSNHSSLHNDEVARMRKLKRRLFLEAVAQSAE
jgi:hypothetical protein